MRVGILHVDFKNFGGGEKYALAIAKVLCDAGHEVEVISLDELNVRELEDFMGLQLDKIKFKKIGAENIGRDALRLLGRAKGGRLALYHALKGYLQFIEFVKTIKSYDVLWETRVALPSPADVTVIHFPYVVSLFQTMKSKSLFKNKIYYSWVYKSLKETIFSAENRPIRFLSSSRWGSATILKLFKGYADVAYFPVDEELFSLRPSGKKKVITITRFDPAKRIHELLYVAKELKDFEFVIVGGAKSESTIKYFKEIKEKVEALNLKNVTLLANISFKRLKEELSDSSIYLHPPFPEHFGISIAEAASAGLPPIVFKDGGGWFDIAKPISEQLGYLDVTEVKRIVLHAYNNLDALSAKAKRYASRKFAYDSFKQAILNVNESIYDKKSIARESRMITKLQTELSALADSRHE